MTTQNERILKENIQKNLIFYRKLRKITQKQLADGILDDICGVISDESNDSITPEEKKLLLDYQKLNETGKAKLQERIEELVLLGHTI